MAQYDESEYFTDSKEEIAEREAQEAMRRLVRTEIRRVHSGEADEDIANDIAREKGTKALEVQKNAKKSGWGARVESLVTGDILLAEEASRVYNFLILLGVIFTISLFAMFGSFQQEMQCSKLRTEVEILKQKAVRTSEIRVQQSTHSAILDKLKARGIKLEDPTTNPIILR